MDRLTAALPIQIREALLDRVHGERESIAASWRR